MIKADLHIHTNYSGDSDITLDALIQRCHETGLGAIAVTDHGTAEGALKLATRELPFKLIIGEEIMSVEGEIIGLFLKETIPSGLTPEETIARIRAQGGVVYVPHPFDRYRSSAMQATALERIAAEIDVVEVFNSRTIPLQSLSPPEKFAKAHNKLCGAGSDSHSTSEIGRACVVMPDFDGRYEFLKSMAQAHIEGKRPSLFMYIKMLTRRTMRSLRRRRKPQQNTEA
ncbi:MAG: PHP domain-containing protein [Dehalococcoidia bacterium]|nr:PHP domain-containing protein [Dehalococcoidia bacterium]